MIIILSVLLGITVLFLVSAIIHIRKIQQELIEIDKEQHTQNKDIIGILKKINELIDHANDSKQAHIDSQKAILEIISVLNGGRINFPYIGTVGEA